MFFFFWTRCQKNHYYYILVFFLQRIVLCKNARCRSKLYLVAIIDIMLTTFYYCKIFLITNAADKIEFNVHTLYSLLSTYIYIFFWSKSNFPNNFSLFVNKRSIMCIYYIARQLIKKKLIFLFLGVLKCVKKILLLLYVYNTYTILINILLYVCV